MKTTIIKPPGKKPWWAPIVHFAVHMAIGSAIFMLIALPGFGLGLLVKFLAKNGAADYVVTVLTFLEYAIVTIDAVVFVGYLGVTSLSAIKEMTE